MRLLVVEDEERLARTLQRGLERFYRADGTRSRASGGSGLGLPIALWVIEAHGGTLHLSSTPGKGATATVLLPLAAHPE